MGVLTSRMVRLTKVSSRMLDMTGMVSGLLTIVAPYAKIVYSNGKNNVYWLAKCECGNSHYVTVNTFNTGRARSCGCLSSSDVVSAKKTSQGTVYSALELDRSSIKYNSLLDKTIGKLTVIDLSHAITYRTKYGHGDGVRLKVVVYWVCQCACGRVVTRSNKYLTEKIPQVKSCGCLGLNKKNIRKKMS